MCAFPNWVTTESSSLKYPVFQWYIHVPFEARVGAVGSMFCQVIGILTELNPQDATFVNAVVGMLHPSPHESGLVEGVPVPNSSPATSTPIRGTTLPLSSYTLVLPGTV
jgi:hypothetical protein